MPAAFTASPTGGARGRGSPLPEAERPEGALPAYRRAAELDGASAAVLPVPAKAPAATGRNGRQAGPSTWRRKY